MPSPNFTVNTSACPPEKAVAYNAAITLALLSTSGINTVAWSIVGTDRPSTAIPTITPGGSPLGATATFTMVADPSTGLGASLLVQCVVNGGRDSAGQADATLTKRALVGVNNTGGVVPFAVGEKDERSTTHGSTMALNQALVAVGSAGAAGVGLLGAVDALATTNNAQSGTTAVDGVTLTAGTSRVLCVGQTTTSQNGIKLVQAGAWTNPTDFNSDAQVIAGQTVFVKPGGLSIPAAGDTWQLVSGATITGAKTYNRLVTNKSIAPVRAVQTLALPANTATTTTVTASANGTLAVTVFDSIASYAVGDRLEVNSLGVAAAMNGVYSVTQAGSGGTPWILTRVTELATSAAFASGAAYDVLDGATLKATRRQLYTQGAIVLGTTPLLFGPVREQDLLKIDVTKPPYNLRCSATKAGTTGNDDTGIVNQAIYDAYVAGGGTVVLPAGWLQATFQPLIMRSKVNIIGQGRNQTWLNCTTSTSGHSVIAVGNMFPLQIGGTFVDSGSTTPLQLRDATHTDAMLDLTRAGLVFSKWAAYTARAMIRLASAPATGGGYIMSTQGIMMIQDQVNGASVTHDSYLVNADGTVTATLRLWSAMGVVPLAAGPTLTLSGLTIPDGIFLRVRIVKAGARGTFEFQYSVNNGASWRPKMVSAATNTVTGFGRLSGLVFNWSNASAALTDSWVNTQSRTVTSTTTVSTGFNWQISGVWDPSPNTFKLYVSKSDGTSSYDATPVTSAAYTLTGACVHAPTWMVTLVGAGVNSGPYGTIFSGSPIDGWIGSVTYSDAVQTHTGVVPQSIPIPASIKFYWLPSTSSQKTTPDGIVWGWSCNFGAGGFGLLIPRRVSNDFGTPGFITTMSLKSIGVDNLTSGQRGGIWLDGPLVRSSFDDIRVSGGTDGFVHFGTGYGNHLGDFSCSSNRLAFGASGNSVILQGKFLAEGTGGGVFITGGAGGIQDGDLEIDLQGHPLFGIMVNDGAVDFRHISLDDEGSGGYDVAPLVLQPLVNNVLRIGGALNTAETYNESVIVASHNGVSVGTTVLDCVFDASGNNSDQLVLLRDAMVDLRLGPNFCSVNGPDRVVGGFAGRTGRHGGVTRKRPLSPVMLATGTSPPVLSLTGSSSAAEFTITVKCTAGGALGVWTYAVYYAANLTTPFQTGTSAATVALTVGIGIGITINMAAGAASTDNVWTLSSKSAWGTSSTQTITPASNVGDAGVQRYEMPASTTTAATAITLGVVAVTEATRLRIKIGVQANNVTIVNGGAAGGTLTTVTAGQTSVLDYVAVADLVTLAVNWELY